MGTSCEGMITPSPALPREASGQGQLAGIPCPTKGLGVWGLPSLPLLGGFSKKELETSSQACPAAPALPCSSSGLGSSLSPPVFPFLPWLVAEEGKLGLSRCHLPLPAHISPPLRLSAPAGPHLPQLTVSRGKPGTVRPTTLPICKLLIPHLPSQSRMWECLASWLPAHLGRRH